MCDLWVPLFYWAHRGLPYPRSHEVCLIPGSHELPAAAQAPSAHQWTEGIAQPAANKKDSKFLVLFTDFSIHFCSLILITTSCSQGMVTLQLMGFNLFWWIIQSQKKVFQYDALKELYRILNLCPFPHNCVDNSMNSVTFKLLS